MKRFVEESKESTPENRAADILREFDRGASISGVDLNDEQFRFVERYLRRMYYRGLGNGRAEMASNSSGSE